MTKTIGHLEMSASAGGNPQTACRFCKRVLYVYGSGQEWKGLRTLSCGCSDSEAYHRNKFAAMTAMMKPPVGLAN